jgi:hypothetical protein
MTTNDMIETTEEDILAYLGRTDGGCVLDIATGVNSWNTLPNTSVQFVKSWVLIYTNHLP